MGMDEIQARVISYLMAKGPSLPVELCKIIGTDTLTSNAILSSLVASNKIKKSYRRIGSSNFYYLPGQEEMLRRKIYESLNEMERGLIEKFRIERVIPEYKLTPNEVEFLHGLMDFIEPIVMKVNDRDIFFWKFHSVGEAEFQEKVKGFMEELKRIAIETKASKEEVGKEDIIGRVEKFIQRIGGKIIEEKCKGKEGKFMVEIQTAFGELEVLVVYKDKKRIDEKDLSVLYAEMMKRKSLLLLITNGKFTKEAEEFLQKNFGKWIKILRLDEIGN
ncbi:MAG: restriction endonuclease [Candidatus Nanoarchaeia archaeon]|nr:restriction endonuclease [Candidatus Haiyanarchaeum thermophilum]MCW1303381.1 restriction endonuclease [Candidatus Haiyanarchaeum thermophilum]MCW1303932.1 restriction endonuclease [Candidatus Haiyanarchaeum thermophilum]MCW1306743.1 restriction endonuclease [Candidatus Haiyanarchaeum thermophilum]MCW1308180.1 restriction endonuclease [Candidatus Haiyanarchaeum thermophilum]